VAISVDPGTPNIRASSIAPRSTLLSRYALAQAGRDVGTASSIDQYPSLQAHPGVLPVHANAFGTTYGELARDWWIWAYGAPELQNPIEDEDGSFGHVGQEGKVWFLAGTHGNSEDDPVIRFVNVPTGKALYVPIINAAWVPFASDALPGEPGYTSEEEARGIMNWLMDMAYDLSCTVDGVEVQGVAGYRAESPTFDMPVTEGSVGQDVTGWEEPGNYGPSMAVGYGLLLAPLSKGEHMIEFTGKFGPAGQDPWLEVSVIYVLTVGK